MMLTQRRTWAGCTLDIEIMRCADPASGKARDARPALRFASEEARAKHRGDMARRAFVRKVNATFRPGDLYATLTFDDAHEVHTFAEARRVRDAYWRRLRRACPGAVMVLVMGRGKSTARIHFHLLAQGVPEAVLRGKWTWGIVLEPVSPLREHNYYIGANGEKRDHGADYRGLATYLFDHWTEEQGGHHYKGTANMAQPEREEPEECQDLYTDQYPPAAPEGYEYLGCDATPYGYVCYHYVRTPARRRRRE